MSDKATARPWVIWEGPSYVGGGADLCIGAGENWLFNMDHRHCEARPHHWGLCDCKPEGDIQIASGPEGKVCPGGDCKHEDCITAEQRANAELIVAAVNAYEAHQRAAQALREPLGPLYWLELAAQCFENPDIEDGLDTVQLAFDIRRDLKMLRAALAELDKVTTR